MHRATGAEEEEDMDDGKPDTEPFERRLRKAGDELCSIVSCVYSTHDRNPCRSGADLARAIEAWRELWEDRK